MTEDERWEHAESVVASYREYVRQGKDRVGMEREPCYVCRQHSQT